MIETHPLDRNRRQRRSTTPWDALPALGVVPRAQLLRWLRSDAPTRRWATLQALGGSTRIEAADTLLEMLLAAGCVEVDERFSAGRWWTHQVTWINLSRLQQALGLPSQDERSDQRSRTLQSLEAMAEAVPALRGVARALAIARLSPTALSARSELLAALALWTAEQRTGVRQDFALHARAHTKAVSEAEWRWLDSELDLGALGIERNASLLWLAAAMTVANPLGSSNLRPWPFVGVPAQALQTLMRVDSAPESYWVIENRASFERQARQRSDRQCVVWVPGRPSGAWLAAIQQLLVHAPAPARVSTDPDPAGIEIALTVGATWTANGLPWQSYAMEPERLTEGKTLPLNDYDRASLARTLEREDLPEALRALALDIQRLGCKAEQEGWL